MTISNNGVCLSSNKAQTNNNNTMKVTFYNYLVRFNIDNAMTQEVFESAPSEQIALQKAFDSIKGVYGDSFLISIKEVKKQNKVCEFTV